MGDLPETLVIGDDELAALSRPAVEAFLIDHLKSLEAAKDMDDVAAIRRELRHRLYVFQLERDPTMTEADEHLLKTLQEGGGDEVSLDELRERFAS